MIEKFGTVTTTDSGVELRRHGTRELPVGVYDNDYTEQEAIWHWHREFELIHMKKGSLKVSIPEEQLVLKEGEILFINSGVMHAAANAGSEPCLFHAIVFSPDFLCNGNDSILWKKYVEPLMEGGKITVTKFPEGTAAAEQVSLELDQFWKACEMEAFGYEFQIRGQLSYVICQVLMEGTPHEKTDKEQRMGRRMKRMLEYLQKHYSETVTVKHLADSVNISESECMRCFRKLLGTSPIQYVKKYRLQMAAELLATSDFTITEIAGKCGFEHMSYFSQSFQQLFGISPREYRKRVEKGNVM